MSSTQHAIGLLATLSAALLTCSVRAAEPATRRSFVQSLAAGDQPAQPLQYKYRTFLPADYEKDSAKKWPLVLFLHGAGERGEDLKQVEAHGPHKFFKDPKNLPFILIYPQCATKQWWQNAALKNLLDEVSAKYRIDPDRIYLTGLSMGGFGTWHLAAAFPQRFAAIVPICGGGNPADADKLKDLPAWVCHGTADRAVPVKMSYDMITALAKVQARVRYTIYPEVGHDCWTATYNNPELYTWLLAQKRGEPKQERIADVPTFK